MTDFKIGQKLKVVVNVGTDLKLGEVVTFLRYMDKETCYVKRIMEK
jgi:hypothetical protein